MPGWNSGENKASEKRGGWLQGPFIYAVILLPVLAVGVFSYLKTKKDLTEYAFSQRRATARLTAAVLQERFDRLLDIGTALATRVQFRRLVEQKRWGEAIEILRDVPKDFPFFERVFLADSAGVETADFPELPGVRGKSFAHRDWYKGVIQTGKPYVSNVYTRAAAPRIAVVSVATPIWESERKLAGIVVLQVALNTLLAWSRQIEVGPSGFVYLVDRAGQLAAHPKYSLKDTAVDFSSVPAVQKVLEGKGGVEALYNPAEREERLSAYEPVPGYGWGVVVTQPAAVALASRDANLRLIYSVYGFALFAGLLCAFLISRTFAIRRRSEEAVWASEERYRLLFETNPLPAWVFDLETLSFLAVNASAVRHYSYSQEEFLKMTIKDIRPAEDVPALLDHISKLEEGTHSPGEWRHRKKDGSVINVEIISHKLLYGGKQAELVLANDITERKQAEEALRKSEEKYRALFDFLDVGICTIEVLFDENDKPIDYRFLEVNSSFEKQTGIQNAPGRRMREIAPLHEEHWFEIYGKIALTGEPLRFENQAAQLHRWYDVYAFRVGEPEKRQVAIHFDDITERKRVEREIEKLNEALQQHAAQLEAANKELEAFSYSVSHDLRAPLRSIDGFSQALLEDCGDRLDESGKDYLGRVRGACLRMAQLIDDLLNLSRVSRGEMRLECVDLSALAREIVDELRKQTPKRKVNFVVADNLTGKGDPRLLRVALENLLSNAWKYTSKHPAARIEFGAQRQPDGKTLFFVRDDGAGFDMAYAGKLFGAFQRLHASSEFAGTGIGLATVQRVVHRHGGRVWAEGSVEQGATFYFTL